MVVINMEVVSIWEVVCKMEAVSIMEVVCKMVEDLIIKAQWLLDKLTPF